MQMHLLKIIRSASIYGFAVCPDILPTIARELEILERNILWICVL